jgi:hypothetical protein
MHFDGKHRPTRHQAEIKITAPASQRIDLGQLSLVLRGHPVGMDKEAPCIIYDLALTGVRHGLDP